MNAFATQLLMAVHTLTQADTIAAVLVGALVGAGLAPIVRQAGLDAASPLVLLLPGVALLDPVAGVMLLGSALAVTLVAEPGQGDQAPHLRGPLQALAAGLAGGLVLIAAFPSVAAWMQGLRPADSVSLLVVAAVLTAGIAAHTRPIYILPSLGLTAVGVAVQLSPLSPLEPEQRSPVPVLLALVVAGPALFALIAPQRVRRPAVPRALIEPAAIMLPGFLVGAPVTLAAAVLAVNLSENGLPLGPNLMTQRPKLVLGFLAALSLAALVGAVGRWIGRRAGRRPASIKFQPGFLTRAAAATLLAIALAVLYRSGLDGDGQLTGLDPISMTIAGTAALLSALGAALGLDLAPLVVGLVIGQLLQPPLTASLQAADGHLGVALTSGSVPLLGVAILTIAAAITWPLIARLVRPRVTTSPPAAPSDPAAR